MAFGKAFLLTVASALEGIGGALAVVADANVKYVGLVLVLFGGILSYAAVRAFELGLIPESRRK